MMISQLTFYVKKVRTVVLEDLLHLVQEFSEIHKLAIYGPAHFCR